MTQNSAVIVGVGPGLGAALVRRFADGGFAVAGAARLCVLRSLDLPGKLLEMREKTKGDAR